MKRLVYVLGILLIIVACSTQKGVVTEKNDTEEITAKDSVEYDLKTFDSKFENWYATKNNPAMYRSQSYYESWNKQYVSAWNVKIRNGWEAGFERIVGYRPNVNYSFELNHRLFYYFQYVEQVLKIKILPNSPKAAQ